MGSRTGPAGEGLLLVAAAASIQLARGRSTEEIELLAAFFNVLGDNLELLTAVPIPETDTKGQGTDGMDCGSP